MYGDLLFDAKKGNYSLSEDLNLKADHIATITSCIFLSGVYYFDDMGFKKYKKLNEYVLNESPSKLCKEIKEVAEYYYNQCDDDVKRAKKILGNNDLSFSAAFAECKKRTLKMAKMSFDEVELFSTRCDIITDTETYSDDVIKKYFTDEEIALYNLNASQKQAKTS